MHVMEALDMGAVHVGGNASFICPLSSNSAFNGGAVYIQGGTVLITSSALSVIMHFGL